MSQTLDLQHFRELLENRLGELSRLEAPDERRDMAVELDQSKVGRLSRMDALQQQAMLDAARGRGQRERGRILQALKRLEEGEYGWCVQCGEAIALGRLNFDPATPLCVSCAEQAERPSAG